jgi:hypothetical protein
MPAGRFNRQRKNSTMLPNLLMAIILPVILPLTCVDPPTSPPPLTGLPRPAKVGDIALPAGYNRVWYAPGSFSWWLRNFPLKQSATVYLFNGSEKGNQSAQFAVLDLSTGNENLQQCADAVMRLRAEYFFEQGRIADIVFSDNNGTRYSPPPGCSRKEFDKYLRQVFGWCGSLSLEKQLKPVQDVNDIRAGDVFIKGGSPGHAAIVMDVAINQRGEKIYLLANSYMPAQDTHIVLNPENKSLSPWFDARPGADVVLPEWTFTARQLRRW